MRFGLTAVAISLALAGAPAARAAEEGRLLRLRLRPGDEWRERVLHEVEAVGSSGRVVWSRRVERVETVRVLSLVTGLGPDAGGSARRLAPDQRPAFAAEAASAEQARTLTRPARRWARIRRTPEPASKPASKPASGDAAAPAPYEILVSSLGELALPPPEDGGPAEDVARAALVAGLVSRYAAVLPEGALPVGGKETREMRLRFAAGAGAGTQGNAAAFVETETATLITVDGAVERGSGGGGGSGGVETQGDVAVLAIVRRAGSQVVPLADEGLAALAPGALVAAASPEELALDVLGASGDGELRFDAARGAILSYRMRETFGVAAKLGRASLRHTVNVRFEVERLE